MGIDISNYSVGKKLKIYRQLAGYTQGQAAKEIGITQQHLSAIEKMNVTLTQRILVALIKLYKIQPSDLK